MFDKTIDHKVASHPQNIVLNNTTPLHLASHLLITGFVICIALVSCAKIDDNAPAALSLDKAIKQSAQEIGIALPWGTRVAVVNFDSESATLSYYVVKNLTGALTDCQLEVVDRNTLLAREKLNLQLSDGISNKTARLIGNLAEVQSVITGQLINTGSEYHFLIQSLNVESAVQDASVALNIHDDQSLREVIGIPDSNKTASRSVNSGVTENIQPQTADVFLDRGITYYNEEDYGQAIADFTQAIRLDPNYTSAYSRRGLAYYKNGNYDNAIASFTQAIKLDPNNADLYVGRALAYYLKRGFSVIVGPKMDYDSVIADLKRDYDSAIADLNEAIRLDPNRAFAYYRSLFDHYTEKDYQRFCDDPLDALRHAEAQFMLEKMRPLPLW
jgi:tetratricopeptide (TPR) repeat protein